MTTESTEGTVAAQQDHVDASIENEVLRRYGDGAHQAEAGLCCPTEYDTSLLKILPDEIVEKDYGCGDPSKHVRKGDTVLDLGSGGGKICYILSQKVGADGSVIGVDFNDKMLTLARKYRGEMAERIGYGNVEFFKGKIQDLGLDLDKLEAWLATHPVTTVDEVAALEQECDRLRREEPMVADNSIDAVVSNCVLNLVRPEDKKVLFDEIHRVLISGGRAIISDIVCDQAPTASILSDPELWSGCISGAFREDEFLEMFEDAGFYGVEVLSRQEEPWHVIDGVEFRSLTVRAYKADEERPRLERNHAVVYRGPWMTVADDDGRVYFRGERMAVCDKTHAMLTDPNGPYHGHVDGVEPLDEVPAHTATPYDEGRDGTVRDPSETKGGEYRETSGTPGSCDSGPGCC